jgi:hypothetical protein
VRICYLDESGVPELAGGTSHFVLLGLSIQGETWKPKDAEITRVKRRFGITDAEIHTAWVARRYAEQEQIKNFDKLSSPQRIAEVQSRRDAYLIKIGATKGLAATKTIRKDFAKSAPYIHLTRDERIELLRQISDAVSGWSDCRVFAECIDKRVFKGKAPRTPPLEEAFTQVVSRFHRFLSDQVPEDHGLLVQDHNETNALRLTQLMRSFHASGTKWTDQIRLIVETPLFVDSQLTSIVQVADVCAYATRRFCENGETDLFDRILPVFHGIGGRLVGVRHYTAGSGCKCVICERH